VLLWAGAGALPVVVIVAVVVAVVVISFVLTMVVVVVAVAVVVEVASEVDIEVTVVGTETVEVVVDVTVDGPLLAGSIGAPRVFETTSPVVLFRMSDPVLGGEAKLNMLRMLPAFTSVECPPILPSDQLFSMNARTDDWSVRVWSTKFCFA